MKRILRTKERSERRRGQAVVEFALILPVFVLLVFGSLEFGRAYFYMHLLTNAAREGAREGSLPNQIESDVGDRVDDFLEGAGIAGAWTTATQVHDPAGTLRAGGLTDAEQGDEVAVTISYSFNVLSGSILPGFSGTVPLRGRCAFRHE